ncbi:hypothetical protein COOONC_15924 [Cooperia oncophora]
MDCFKEAKYTHILPDSDRYPIPAMDGFEPIATGEHPEPSRGMLGDTDIATIIAALKEDKPSSFRAGYNT